MDGQKKWNDAGSREVLSCTSREMNYERMEIQERKRKEEAR